MKDTPAWKRVRVGVVLGLVAISIILVALNWSALTVSTPVHLLVVRFEAPLGVLVLMLVGAASLAFLVFFARFEAEARGSDRRLLRELEQIRSSIDDGQASIAERLRVLEEEQRQGRRG